MELINKSDFFTEALNFSKSFNKKSITNYYYYDSLKSSLLIQDEKLFSVKINEVVFIIKRNNIFSNLYYFASDSIELQNSLKVLLQKYPDLIFIVDIVTTIKESDVFKVFSNQGFNIYTSLVRMSRITDGYVLSDTINDVNLKTANLEESLVVFHLLHVHFDPMAEQLPSRDDIIDWFKNESILVYKNEEKVVGFIIYQLVGLTLYLRYWFVAPNYREMKIGSKLFNFFLIKGKGSKRQLFWVIQTNKNAITRYEHYGFKKEKMFNFVLINNNSKYEE